MTATPAEPRPAAPARPADDGLVRVRGAAEHNLRDLDLDIPRNRLVAFTGVSGSGKSSLAFGTIYAEAQRRYFESVAPYARRLLDQVGAPKVTDITGLPPAVALRQRRGAGGARSSVGTITTLSNLLRMLYSRTGTYPEGAAHLDAESFSPNTAAGACPGCGGLGETHDVDPALLVPDDSLSIRDGAIAAWPGAWQGANLRSVVAGLGIDIDRPWRELDPATRDWLLFTEEQPRVFIQPQDDRIDHSYHGTFRSARTHIRHVLATSASERMRRRALSFTRAMACPDCAGTGLRAEARAVTFAGAGIDRATALPMAELADLLRPAAENPDPAPAVPGAASGERTEVARRIAADLRSRIAVLLDLGLGYLSLDRRATTLSAGEAQRLRLATQLRSGLFGVVYVLDEPSAGLHPADKEPLQEVLTGLRDAGNSLFVVEHDLDLVRRADWVVDIGPGAGEHGGRVVHAGPPAELAAAAGSATGDYLAGRRRIRRRPPRPGTGAIRLTGVRRHNLRDLDAVFPLGALTAVTGVSGSGKSTLVTGVLADAVRGRLDGAGGGSDAALRIDAAEPSAGVDRLVLVDQRPIGRTPRSTPATYVGLFDAVRRLFAGTPEARRRGWSPGRFSFNVAGGRCPTCEGDGFVEVELLFLPGSHGPCPDCRGARYTPETLEVTWGGRSIAEVLDMTVDEALAFFAGEPAVARGLAALAQVGLGYLRLGQPATELSGGEAQRVKIAAELQRARRGRSLYLLDEPTAGLHPADAELLFEQLRALVDDGATVVLVEHDLDLIAAADHVIDLGPGGGDSGGRVVAAGAPAEIAAAPGSVTGRYLARRLAAGAAGEGAG